MPKIELLNIDCMEYMATLPGKAFDLAIVDPPYGIGDFRNSKVRDERNGKKYTPSTKKYKLVGWNNSPPGLEYFLEVKRVAKNHIIFGFQYYMEHLWPELRGIIIHDFKDNAFQMSHADCAITNLQKRTTVFRYLWAGFKKDFKEEHDKNRIHPCEKPVQLYKWLLKNYTKPGHKILDTHLGSGSIAIACHDMKFDLVGCEIDKDYYEAAKKRLINHQKQLQIF